MLEAIINWPWFHSMECAMVIRLIVAAILGGIVGLERGSGDRPAGFRTHILVCVGSALFMLVSLFGFGYVGEEAVSVTEADYGQRRDSTRIAAQVVSGIGFLGAGTILHEGLTIRGLTTAASLWMVSAIGLAVGSGMYFLGTAATVITMITLVTFHTWEKRFAVNNRNDRRFVRVVGKNRSGFITDVTGTISMNSVQVKSLNVKTDKEKSNLCIELYLKLGKNNPDAQELIRKLEAIDGVISVQSVK